MSLLSKLLSRAFVARLGLALLLTGAAAQAQTASQTVPLVSGWNSLWLEVEPIYPPGGTNAGQAMAPADVFTNPAIDIVATPKPLAGSAEFFGSNPDSVTGVTTFNKEDWLQYKRADVASQNNLTNVVGNHPYLIHTTGAVSMNITGKVRFFRPAWTPDRFNLFGFGLEGTRTFADFFGPSGTKHTVDKIFALKPDGSWVKVSSLPSQTMNSDIAYWIFSSGMSTYMGPVGFDFDHSVTGVLDFSGPSDSVSVGTDKLDLEELTFTNYGPVAATPGVTPIATDSNLSLFRVNPDPANQTYIRSNAFTTPGVTIPAQANNAPSTVTFTIGAKRTFLDDVAHLNLYRLRTGGSGASFYLPVSAVRSEVQISAPVTTGLPADSRTGLWVGDVVVDSSTSIVVNGAPVQPSAGSAPLRIIMHSDTSGAVRLLSAVTLMQTKTADPNVSGTPVLVVDPTQIPFFQGIKHRADKLVGVRLEAVAYDMPRSASAWSGADLVTFPTRPPTLKEIYDLTRLMSGAIGQTVTASLTLDPFHRSNPLRHAFHQDLTKGPKITRTIKLVFDANPPVPDQLTASFSDTINGLIKDTLVLTGHVSLRRVSPVGALQGQ